MKNYLCCADFNRAGLNRLLNYVLAVYKECNVTTLPIDCIAILQHYGFKVLSYSELKKFSSELYDICQKCTDDAFTYDKIIAYNENNMPERIRFSLMHELGHFIMDIPSTDKSYEDIADYFASNILVPRATIWHMRSDSIRNICRTYAVSCMAANRIYEDYKICRLSECKEVNNKIHDCFFPSNTSATSVHTIKYVKTEETAEKHSKYEEYHEILEKYFPERLHNYVLE